LRVRALDNVPSESSSREKLVGDRPPPVVNEKSCGSLGTASLTTTTWALFWFVKVQVTVSFGLTLMFPTGLPSLHLALPAF
jgi:hypothetical protein